MSHFFLAFKTFFLWEPNPVQFLSASDCFLVSQNHYCFPGFMTIINRTFSLIQGTLSLLGNRNQLCLFLIFTIYLYFWYASFFYVDPYFCHSIFLLTKNIFNISFRAGELMTKCSQLSLFVKIVHLYFQRCLHWVLNF